MLTFRHTLVAPGSCPFCLVDQSKKPDERFSQWMKRPTLLNHIDKHLDEMNPSMVVGCPHPCYKTKEYTNSLHLRRHFHDFHSFEGSRSNCVTRKRKWKIEPEHILTNEDINSAHRRRLNVHPYLEEGSPEIDSPLNSDDCEIGPMDKIMEEYVRSDDFE
jgi:hypothetical protein